MNMLRLTKSVACVLIVMAFLSLMSIVLDDSVNAVVKEYAVYYPDVDYPNLKACYATPGGGVWTTPIHNRIREPFHEIGVLEIMETQDVNRVEFYGSGCVYPVKLTCNGITKKVNYYHDYDPYVRYGEELIAFEITPTRNITAYTLSHEMRDNIQADYGFRIYWVKVYFLRSRENPTLSIAFLLLFGGAGLVLAFLLAYRTNRKRRKGEIIRGVLTFFLSWLRSAQKQAWPLRLRMRQAQVQG